MKRSLASGLTVALTLGLVALGVSAPAVAYAPTDNFGVSVSGVAACQTDGTYSITWTYSQVASETNTAGRASDVTATAQTPDGTLLDGVAGPEHFSGSGVWSKTFVQSGIPGDTRSATVQTTTVWKGGSYNPTHTVLGQVFPTGDCVAPTPKAAAPGLHLTNATCTTGQTVVLNTPDHYTWSPITMDGTTYTVTATVVDGYVFPDGTTTKTFTGTLSPPVVDGSCGPTKVVPADPTVTPQVCVNGSYSGGTIVTAETTGLVYTVRNSNGVVLTAPYTNLTPGNYTVSVSALPGYQLTGDSAWPLTVTVGAASTCTTITTTATATDQTCTDDLDNPVLVPGLITVALNDKVIYKIDGTVVTSATTEVSAGDHHVTAELTPAAEGTGVALSDTSWDLTVAEADCLPTLAEFPANATATDATCAADGNTTSGYITVDFFDQPGFEDAVQYFIGTTQLTHAKTNMAPGTYVVDARINPADTGDTVSPTSFTLTIANPATVCGDLTTLAFTGSDPTPGLAIAGGMLVFGFAGLYLRRRYTRRAE